MAKHKSSSKKQISVMGAVTLGTLLAVILGTGNNGKIQYAGSPIGYLMEKNGGQAVAALGRNMASPGTYLAVGVPLVIWIGGHAIAGSKPVAKGVKMF